MHFYILCQLHQHMTIHGHATETLGKQMYVFRRKFGLLSSRFETPRSVVTGVLN